MIRVFIVDDHSIFREGVKKVIADTNDIIVIGEAGDGREALKKLAVRTCDVLLLDLALSGVDGFEILQSLRANKITIPVLVLSMYPEEHYATRAFKAGASGYVTKDSVAADLIRAIRKVAAGGRYVSEHLAEQLAYELGREVKEQPHESLTDREYQIFVMTASGKSAKEISRELSLARTTVSSYRTRILKKMNMNSTAELVRYAVEQRLMKPNT